MDLIHWPTIPAPAPGTAPSTSAGTTTGPGSASSGPTPAEMHSLVKRLLHAYAVQVGPPVYTQIQVAANAPVRILAANPLRIMAAVQLPAGMVAYEGRDANVSSANGYQYPIGGGWTYGPSDTGEFWIVATSAGIVTVKEENGDVPYP